MIDFACKKLNLEEVIRCSLNLTKTEYKILDYLIKNHRDQFTTQEVSRIFKMGLSTTQKAIKKISDEGLIKKIQKNRSKGGYILIYSIKEKLILKEKILNIINNWVQKVEIGIKNW